jgi:hypothetical protein
MMTTKVTCPGRISFRPSVREISLQYGGKMLETRTRLLEAIPAERKASSKLDRRSLCLPTPLVRKIFLGTNILFRTPFPTRTEIIRGQYGEKGTRCQSPFSRYSGGQIRLP